MEGLKGRRAGERLIVHQERGRAPKAARESILQIVVYRRLGLARVQALNEPGNIQSDFGGVGFEVAYAQRRRMVEEHVVVFPEYALIVSTLRGFSRFGGLRGDDWKVAPDEAHLVVIFRPDLIEDARPVPCPAGGATKIALFDDRNRRGGGAERRVVGKPRCVQWFGLRTRP